MSDTLSSADFVALIPARLGSSRLPGKPLADIGGLPMIVRVARQAQASGAQQVVVACDDVSILQACAAHGVQAILTSPEHPSGSDRLSQACRLLGLAPHAVVVNVQGDEPLIDPALVTAVAHKLIARPDCAMSTAAHCLESVADWINPNVVKVVLDHQDTALYFSRAPIPWWRDGPSDSTGKPQRLPAPAPLRHVGVYAYRVDFLLRFPGLEPAPMEQVESLEQLRALWHGQRIAVHICPQAPAAGVDTPQDLERVRALVRSAS